MRSSVSCTRASSRWRWLPDAHVGDEITERLARTRNRLVRSCSVLAWDGEGPVGMLLVQRERPDDAPHVTWLIVRRDVSGASLLHRPPSADVDVASSIRWPSSLSHTRGRRHIHGS
jgi:hypothetical protein